LHAVFSYKSLQAVPWVLIASLPVEEAYAPIARAQERIVGVTLLLALLLAPLMWLGTRYLLTPLLTLHDTIRHIREHPNADQEVTVKTRDEIGDLAHDFNDLMRERKQAEQERELASRRIEESEDRLRAITDSAPALIGYIDAGRRFRFNNRTYEDWLGVSRTELTGRTLREALGEKFYGAIEPYVEKALGGQDQAFETQIDERGGGIRYLRVQYVPHFGPENRVLGFYSLANDVTELKLAEQALFQLTRYDSLCGLPNRTTFSDRIGQAMARAKRNKTTMALLYLDIDRFKAINDKYGHAVGDEVLRQCAALMGRLCRQSDLVARIGGEEFALILPGMAHDPAIRFCDTMRHAVESHNWRSIHPELQVTVSIGLYQWNGDSDAADLLQHADTQLYRAKNEGRNRVA